MKAIVLLKRRPDITHEEFRRHYETVHVELAHKYLGHLLTAYRRNYPNVVETDANAAETPSYARGPYDAITEIHFSDMAAFEESQRIMSDPVIGKIFADDEENFLDRSEFRIFVCDEVESPLQA